MSKREQAEAAESSTAAEQVQEDQTDANAAKSSDADGNDANAGEDSRETLLSVIEAVAPEEDTTEDSSTSESEAETESEDETDADAESEEDSEDTESEEDTDEEDEAEDSDRDPPFHNHPRWKEMVAERDQYKQGAQQFDQIQTFMNSNNLEPQEVAEGFQLMSLLKNDPARAKQQLERIVNNLQQFDPDYLPADLEQEVNDGVMTEDRAREIARLRAENSQAQFQNQRVQQQQTKTQEQLQREAQQARATALATAVNGWEAEVKNKDADYAKKAPFVRDRLQSFLTREGYPDNPEKAIELAQRAHKEVTREFRKLQPKKPASRPVPSSGGSSSQKPEPKSLQEAIDNAIG